MKLYLPLAIGILILIGGSVYFGCSANFANEIRPSPSPSSARGGEKVRGDGGPAHEGGGTLPVSGAPTLSKLQILVQSLQDPNSDWEAILDRLEAEFEIREVLPHLREVARSSDSTKVERVLDWIAGRTTEDIIPVLESCLGNPDEAVRLAAVNAASQVTTSGLVGLMEKVFRDPSAQVRLTFFNQYEHQSDAILLRVWEKALIAPHHDVRDAGIGELELQSNHRSVEVLFSALDSPYLETRAEAQAALDFMLDKEFSSGASARGWWKMNRQRFSTDLVPEAAESQ